ncbi:MAG: hypothetical protein K0U98_03785 [Deltaproteobacteria bacterium]|nr:hypothetical protein [Deltaproteobacteria bacterium]
MAKLDPWTARIEAIPEGEIWLEKLKYDRQRGNLKEVLVDKFSATLDSTLEEDLSDEEALGAIDQVGHSDPEGYFLQGTRQPRSRHSYCRILDVGSFAHKNLDLASIGLELDEKTATTVWEEIGSLITEDLYTNDMRTRKPFFWATPIEDLEKAEPPQGPQTVACSVRNHLGLHHYGEGTHLLRIDVPHEAVKGKKVKAPTCLDAGSYPYFFPTDHKDGYGRTLDLQTKKYGAREAVVETLEFNSSYQVSKLGRVSTQPPHLATEDLLVHPEERMKGLP